MHRVIELGCAASVFATLVSFASGALAESVGDADDAQVLYDSATALMDDGKVSEACPKLEEVTKLVPDGLGARLTLAECYEREGRLASAWQLYSSTAVTAARTGQSARLEKASQKALALSPRLARLTVKVSEPALQLDGLTIRRDGAVMNRTQWGEGIPVDVGDHVIEVESAGRSPWHHDVHVARDGVMATVSVDASGGDAGVSDGSSSSRSWQRPTGYVVSAVGLTTLVVGATLGGLAIAKSSESGKLCSPTLVCSMRGLELRDQARTFGNASTAMIVIGAVTATAGVVIVVSSPKRRPTALAVGPGFLAVRGSF